MTNLPTLTFWQKAIRFVCFFAVMAGIAYLDQMPPVNLAGFLYWLGIYYLIFGLLDALTDDGEAKTSNFITPFIWSAIFFYLHP